MTEDMTVKGKCEKCGGEIVASHSGEWLLEKCPTCGHKNWVPPAMWRIAASLYLHKWADGEWAHVDVASIIHAARWEGDSLGDAIERCKTAEEAYVFRARVKELLDTIRKFNEDFPIKRGNARRAIGRAVGWLWAFVCGERSHRGCREVKDACQVRYRRDAREARQAASTLSAIIEGRRDQLAQEEDYWYDRYALMLRDNPEALAELKDAPYWHAALEAAHFLALEGPSGMEAVRRFFEKARTNGVDGEKQRQVKNLAGGSSQAACEESPMASPLSGQEPDTCAAPPPANVVLADRVKVAYAQYLRAVPECPGKDGREPTDQECFDWLNEHSDGDRLPAFKTWQRYVREARRVLDERKNTPRTGRPGGRSIVSAEDIEPASTDEAD